MEALIPVINKLQDVLNTTNTSDYLHLPQIVVVGSQSSGKSSVLENIVGRTFLPRGTGIVTRCPLILQLNNSQNEYVEFLHKPDHRFTDYDHVRTEIETETNRLAGTNKNIVTEPISLKIYSQKVVNLTLVDLPGLTKVPIGDQPDNIEDQIKHLIISYIQNPNSIILAVVTANNDIATSESLKLAKEIDPQGKRTLVVLTKLDLMDEGTDATELLSGKIIPIKLGIIAVVNRSQQDIFDRKSIEDSLKDEMVFLRRKYPLLAKYNGTTFLAKTLNRLLMFHIRACLPHLKDRLNQQIAQLQTTVDAFGAAISDKNQKLLQVIMEFVMAYCKTCTGVPNENAIATATACSTNLLGGARIGYIFHETFWNALNEIRPLQDLSKRDILTTIMNSLGPKTLLFFPQTAFEMLIKKQINRLKAPSMLCADLVYEEMLRIVHNCGDDVQISRARFPLLMDKIISIVMDLLGRRLPATKEMIQNLIDIELAYLNFKQPEFSKTIESVLMQTTATPMTTTATANIGSNQSAALVNGNSAHGVDTAANNNSNNNNCEPADGHPASETLSPKDLRDCLIMEKLLTSYFETIRKHFQTIVPKTIMCFLVKYVTDNLHSELILHLYHTGNVDELLKESDEIVANRNETMTILDSLHKAKAIISDIKDINF